MSDGIPAPNPIYKIPIKNVTGNANVKTQNKNLLPELWFTQNRKTISVNGVTATINVDNTITLTGTATERTLMYFKPFNLKFGAGTYQYISNSNANLRIESTLITDGAIAYANSFNNTPFERTAQESFEITGSILVIAEGQATNTTLYFFVQEKNIDTSYVEHQEQNYPFTLGNIELCKIGDCQDYFYKENGKWYLHKEIDKVVFNGSSNVDVWGNATRVGTSSFYRFANSAFNDTTKYKSLTPYISDKFIFDNVNSLQEKNVISNTSATGLNRLWITIDTTLMNGTTVDDFKTWLSTHNTEVYYLLATPTDIKITDTTLIQQLEAISQARSYDDITYITSTSDELGFDMKAIAIADANKVIDNQNNEIDTIKSRLDLLEG